MTTVTILGAGNMARGIATRLLAASGNTIRILAPHAEHATGLAAQLAGDAGRRSAAAVPTSRSTVRWSCWPSGTTRQWRSPSGGPASSRAR